MRRAVRGMAVAAVLLAGCQEDDDAKDKCETLVRTFCDTVTSCAAEAELLDEDYGTRELFADCEETVGDGAHCEDAKQVTSRYNDCLEASSSRLDCDASNQSLLSDQTFIIPAVCEGVVGY